MGKGKRSRRRSSVASVAPGAVDRGAPTRYASFVLVGLELLEVLGVAVAVVGGAEPEDGLALP